jgi:glutamate racemase
MRASGEAGGALGILDWGIGGLGFFELARRAHPHAAVIYVSDAGATPYGKLPPAQLAARVREIATWLRGRGVQHLVVACHAASTVLPRLGVDGVSGGIVTAAGSTEATGVVAHAVRLVHADGAHRVGVVGGRRTIRSGIYRRALAGRGIHIVQRVAQPLSAHIEAGALTSATLRRDLDQILAPLAREDIDALLLACTHYPAIAPQFAVRLPGARLLDPAAETLRWVSRHWLRKVRSGPHSFVTTGDPAQMRHAARLAFGVRLGKVARIDLP